MKDGLAALFWFGALGVATIYYVIVVGRLILIAVRTGRLQARGRVYDKSAQPGRYWLLMIASITIGVVLITLSIVLLSAFFRT